MSENGKPKIGMYWGSACGGCEISVLGIGDKIYVSVYPDGQNVES